MIEQLGIVAGFIILFSLLMTSIKLLRYINLIGALLFALYGYLIGAWPVFGLNAGIVVVNIYYLSQMMLAKDYFQFVSFNINDALAQTFLDNQKDDIERFMGYDETLLQTSTLRFFILRNTDIAGLFLAQPIDKETMLITLDYVIKPYRDTVNGKKMLAHATMLWRNQGVKEVVAYANTPQHQRYLKALGFTNDGVNTPRHTKEILRG